MKENHRAGPETGQEDRAEDEVEARFAGHGGSGLVRGMVGATEGEAVWSSMTTSPLPIWRGASSELSAGPGDAAEFSAVGSFFSFSLAPVLRGEGWGEGRAACGVESRSLADD